MGAGIVVVHEDTERVLVLFTRDGEADLPKGHSDEGEAPFVTAIRETREEAGIEDLDFVWGTKKCFCPPSLWMFVAKTTAQPRLRPNPITGQQEHSRAVWMTWDEAVKVTPPFLQRALEWARGMACG